MDHYAVFGHPVGHSKSPWIHQQFARQTGQSLDYVAIEAPLDDFSRAVRQFFDNGLGANVTVPFKEQAFRLARQLTGRARRAGAVNTLKREADGLLGDTTDGAGLVQDLCNHGIDLQGLQILVLGAGGAVRGVIEPLLASCPAGLTIANRTPEKAVALARLFADLGPVTASGLAELNRPFDLIINGTSSSLGGELPPVTPQLIQSGHTLCYDMMYGAAPTCFNRWALAHGAARTLDGLGMLVEQAAEAFALWRGVRPDGAPVLAALRQQLRGAA